MLKTRLISATFFSAFSALLLSLTVALPASAYEAGDWILRAGVANASPNDSSSVISLNGAALPGTSVGVEDETQLGVTITYMLTQRLGLELLVSTPFEHEITAQGIGVDSIGTADHLPPTLSLQYYLLNPQSRFQPYVGIGINYTTFFSEGASAEFEAALGESRISVDDSVGIAAEIGADYALNEHWSLNANIWRIDLDTEAEIQTSAGLVTADVDIDPWVFMFGMAYKF